MTVERLQRHEVNISMFKDMSHGEIETGMAEVLKLPTPNITVAKAFGTYEFESPTHHRAYLNDQAWNIFIDIYSAAAEHDPLASLSIDYYINSKINTEETACHATYLIPLPNSLTELYRFHKIDFSYKELPPLEDTYKLVVCLFPE